MSRNYENSVGNGSYDPNAPKSGYGQTTGRVAPRLEDGPVHETMSWSDLIAFIHRIRETVQQHNEDQNVLLNFFAGDAPVSQGVNGEINAKEVSRGIRHNIERVLHHLAEEVNMAHSKGIQIREHNQV